MKVSTNFRNSNGSLTLLTKTKCYPLTRSTLQVKPQSPISKNGLWFPFTPWTNSLPLLFLRAFSATTKYVPISTFPSQLSVLFWFYFFWVIVTNYQSGFFIFSTYLNRKLVISYWDSHQIKTAKKLKELFFMTEGHFYLV